MLQSAIERMHHCQAIHQKTVHVREQFQGQTVWDGDVEIFELNGHPKALRCFAWLHQDGKDVRYVAFLESVVLNSPGAAVRALIALGFSKAAGSHLTSLDPE